MTIDIVFSPTGGGHRSASLALAQAIRDRSPTTEVTVRDVLAFAPRAFRYDRLWHATQQHGGRIYDWLFDVMDRPPPWFLAIRERLNRALLAALVADLEARQPDHVVCTHYLPAIAAAWMRSTGRLRGSLSVVITDYLAHAAWLLPGVDRYFVASPAVADELAARGIREVVVSGIPIAPAMDDRITAPDTRRVLLLASGVPWPLVRTALRSIPRTTPLDLVAGGDPTLRARLADEGRGPVHGFVPGLRALIDRAGIVVTKAGGLITTECLARGRAMVLPWPAPGHERGNRAHVVAAGAARALADPAHTGAAIASLPYVVMGQAAARAAQRGAADRIARVLVGAAERRQVGGA
ncbi:MAG TPA: hypothetical protein VFQ53_13205 [Kofleriaceae bacterium]|nr:hypothetical protein [Kofleriaceae bacterium]